MPRSESQQVTKGLRSAYRVTTPRTTWSIFPSREATKRRSALPGSEVIVTGWLNLPIGCRVAAAADPQSSRQSRTGQAIRIDRSMQSPRRRRSSLPTHFSANARMADCSWIGKVEIGAAAGANLDVQLDHLVTVGALPFGFVLLRAEEDHRDQAEARQHHADQQPDPKGAALAFADDGGG